MDWNHDYTDLPDLRMHYVRHGTGMSLVLLHGWPEFWYAWRKNIPALARHFDVIAPDLRGFGDTEKPDATPRVDDYVVDVAALADRLGLDRFGIVCHDVGAFLAQAFAHSAPERLTGLFFFNCPYPGIGRRWAEADHLKEIWYQSFHQLDWAKDMVGSSREACRLYLRHFLGHWSHDPRTFEDDLEVWVDNFLKPGNLQGGFDWYKAVNASRLRLIREGAPALPTIHVPTRVLWGESDPVIPAGWTDRLADYFSDIRIDVVPQAGHFVHYEQPDRANREIVEFFSRLG